MTLKPETVCWSVGCDDEPTEELVGSKPSDDLVIEVCDDCAEEMVSVGLWERITDSGGGADN